VTLTFSRLLGKHLLLAFVLMFFISACSNSDTAASTESTPKQPLPEQNSAGAKLLIDYCSECHAPPRPSQHIKGEWKSTVLRMRDHRTYQGYHTLSDEQVVTLTEYLDKHAPEK